MRAYFGINLAMFFAGLISFQTSWVVPWLSLPNVGINVHSFFTMPDGRLFIVGSMYRGLMEYDSGGRHVRTHRDPTVDERAKAMRWAVAQDGRIFAAMKSRERDRYGVAEYDDDLKLIAWHDNQPDAVPALADDGSFTFAQWTPDGDDHGPSRPIRPGEKLFHPEIRKESFTCDDGGSIQRAFLGLRRFQADGSSRRVGPSWWLALFTPPIGFIIAAFVLPLSRRWR